MGGFTGIASGGRAGGRGIGGVEGGGLWWGPEGTEGKDAPAVGGGLGLLPSAGPVESDGEWIGTDPGADARPGAA
jgi:hypothetical protein